MLARTVRDTRLCVAGLYLMMLLLLLCTYRHDTRYLFFVTRRRDAHINLPDKSRRKGIADGPERTPGAERFRSVAFPFKKSVFQRVNGTRSSIRNTLVFRSLTSSPLISVPSDHRSPVRVLYELLPSLLIEIRVIHFRV